MSGERGLSVLDHVPDLKDGVQRRTVRDIVAEKIALLIASGILRAGDPLPSERDLAAAFQVSRESVRGGVQILSLKGVLEVSQGARTRVIATDLAAFAPSLREPRIINAYALDDVHAARLHVEMKVVADAAARIDDDTLDLLERSLDEQRQAFDDPVRFLIFDREFHLAIYRASGNPVLADFVADLYGYLMSRRRDAVSLPGSIVRSHEDHTAIVAALKLRSPEAAAAAFRIHIDRIYLTTRSLIGSGALTAG